MPVNPAPPVIAEIQPVESLKVRLHRPRMLAEQAAEGNYSPTDSKPMA